VVADNKPEEAWMVMVLRVMEIAKEIKLELNGSTSLNEILVLEVIETSEHALAAPMNAWTTKQASVAEIYNSGCTKCMTSDRH